MIKKLNVYFFGEEDIPFTDTFWFYGQYVFMITVFAFLIIINLTM